jgi:hypothetical protein
VINAPLRVVQADHPVEQHKYIEYNNLTGDPVRSSPATSASENHDG